MFYPDRMCRVTVAAPKKHMKDMINALYAAKALHIESYLPKNEGMSIGSPLEDAEKISEMLLDIESIKSAADFKGIMAKGSEAANIKWSLRNAEKYVKGLKSDVSRISTDHKAAVSRIRTAEKALSDTAFLKECGIKNMSILNSYEKLDMIFGFVKAIEPLKSSRDIIVFSSKNKDKLRKAAIFFRKDSRQKLDELLARAKFVEARIDISNALDYKNDIDKLRKDADALQKELEDALKTNSSNLSFIQENLLSSIAKSEAPLKFACSEHAFVVQGWVPEKNKGLLSKKMGEISDNIFVKIEYAEKAPTVISNPGPVKPFEFFLQLYSLPSYKEIDPSFLIFLTFPLFYGIMLGDIGYGAILITAGLILRFKVKSFPKALADVTILSSLFTILFGFVFGEFFGAEEMFGYQLHPYIHRITQVSEMIMYSVILGLIHLNIGFTFGFVNELKHGIYKAIGKISWMGLETGGILMLLNFMHVIKFNTTIGVAIIVISLIGILKGEGFAGVIEIPSLIGNILSYARLAAIGLASASLAIVINKSAGGLFHAGGLFMALGLILLLIGHGVNLALGIMDAFLQSLRLHYVEMFTKFYKGDGKPYKPFGG